MSNQAAWVTSKGARLTVSAAPYPTLEPGQVVIKNAAVAINPAEWKMQDSGVFVKSWPTVLGCDVAGEVVEVGNGVTKIKKGQRVLGHPVALLTGRAQDAAFQLYSSVAAVLVAPIPDELSFEDASVVPLSPFTAAASLYEKSLLALPHPIVSTTSKRNFEYVKALGAETVINHSSSAAVDDLVKALEGHKFVGAYDCIGLPGSVKPATEVVSRLGGGMLVGVLDPPNDLPANVEGKRIFAISIKDTEVSKAVYGDYLPKALKDGSFKAMPKATVIGKGLGSLQGGFDQLKKGVSATKLVVSLQ